MQAKVRIDGALPARVPVEGIVGQRNDKAAVGVASANYPLNALQILEEVVAVNGTSCLIDEIEALFFRDHGQRTLPVLEFDVASGPRLPDPEIGVGALVLRKGTGTQGG